MYVGVILCRVHTGIRRVNTGICMVHTRIYMLLTNVVTACHLAYSDYYKESEDYNFTVSIIKKVNLYINHCLHWVIRVSSLYYNIVYCMHCVS